MDVRNGLERIIRFVKKVFSKPAEFQIFASQLDRWARFEATVRRERTIVRWFIMTLLGGFLLFYLWVQVYRFLQITQIVNANPSSLTVEVVTHDLLILSGIIVLIFGSLVLYSLASSHSLPQKRFVSPVDLCGVVIGFLIVIMFFVPSRTTIAAVGIALIASLGWGANLIMKRIVGLANFGTHQRTLEVGAPMQNVFAKFTIDVRDTFGLLRGRRSHDDRLVIYRNNAKTYRFYVVLAKHPRKPEKATLVHFESYNIGEYSIGTNAESQRRFDRDIDYFEKIIHKEKPCFSFRKTTFDHTFPFRDQVKQTVLEPVEGKISVIPRLPKRTILIVLGILVLALTTYFYSSQPQNAPLATVVGVLLVLLPIIPYLRGPAPERKWQQD
jgi:hypothetical protein